ncbi:MAG: ABC transporter substrate-binding protein [Chloroflexi bacterium]|nr:ABC transporter substrate-binding protein [Chloroflexota bacterium]
MLKGLRSSLVFISALLLLLVLACARAAPTATPTRAPVAAPTPTKAAVLEATPTAKREPQGILSVIDQFASETFLPRMVAIESYTLNIGEPLFGWDWSRDSATNKAIFESWDYKQNPDGSLDWTFKVRKGVKFHKGWGEVTAEDVKYTLLSFLKPGSVSPETKAVVDFFESKPDNLVVKDPYTLVLHQSEPAMVVEIFRGMSADTNTGPKPFPKKYMEQVGEDEFNKNPVFAGPYEFVSQVRGSEIKFKAVPDHYRVVPGFAQMSYLKVLEEATKIAMLRTGQVDVAPVLPISTPELKAAGIKIAVSEYASDLFVILGGVFPGREKYDPKVPWAGQDPLSEKPTKVRKALSLAVDRQAIVDKLLLGYGEVGVVPFSFITSKFPWWNPEWKPIPYDPKQAKQLMTEAGYPNCFEAKTYFVVDDPISPSLGEAIVSVWERDLGCKFSRTPGEWRPVFRTMVLERNTAGWTYAYQGRPVARPFRYACFNGGPAYQTIVHTEFPFYTELCAKARKALTEKELLDIERQIGDEVYKYVPTVEVALAHQTFGVGPKVKEWTPMPTNSLVGNLEYALPK